MGDLVKKKKKTQGHISNLCFSADKKILLTKKLVKITCETENCQNLERRQWRFLLNCVIKLTGKSTFSIFQEEKKNLQRKKTPNKLEF